MIELLVRKEVQVRVVGPFGVRIKTLESRLFLLREGSLIGVLRVQT